MSGSAEEDEEVQRDMLEELAVHGAASRASVKRILPKQEKPKVRGNDNLGKAAVKGPRTLYAAGQQIDPSVFADPI